MFMAGSREKKAVGLQELASAAFSSYFTAFLTCRFFPHSFVESNGTGRRGEPVTRHQFS